tara:strand:+ start:7919 stop:8941 length:1023 start_codon:yes stop_codon:yes gene_type:complete
MKSQDIKIGVIALYFGDLPETFYFWLKSAAFNPSIDFHLVGDCFEGLSLPKNIFAHALSFDALQGEIGRTLGARPLNSPHKLCDFKPSYGALFADMLEGYDIWGFSDLDLIYGDLRGTIVFEKIRPDWGRIFDYGHLSFFPNVPQVTHAFAEKLLGVDTWRFVKNSRFIWIYDEHYYAGFGGVNGRLQRAGYRVESRLELFSDILPSYNGFFDNKIGQSSNSVYLWHAGKITELRAESVDSTWTELSYVHFQKRGVGVHWLDDDRALLVPSHWDAPKMVDEAVLALVTYASEDAVLRPEYATPRLNLRLKKWFHVLAEVLSLPGGLVAFGLYLKNAKYKR